MPQPRKPIEHLKLVGGYRKDRHAEREHVPVPTGELGLPPAHLVGRGEREAWIELSSAAPWLTASDRVIAEVTARLMAMCRADPAVPAAYLAQLQAALGRLGLSPADRRKVLVRKPEPDREQSPLALLAAKRRGAPEGAA